MALTALVVPFLLFGRVRAQLPQNFWTCAYNRHVQRVLDQSSEGNAYSLLSLIFGHVHRQSRTTARFSGVEVTFNP